MKELEEIYEKSIYNVKDVLEQLNNKLSLLDNGATIIIEELEKTINKIKNRTGSIPEDLIKLKLDSIKKLDDYKYILSFKEKILSEIKSLYESCSKRKLDDDNKAVISGGKEKHFIFEGKEYRVKNWKEMYVKICEIIYSEKPKVFYKITTISGRKRNYFSKNKNDIFSPKKIKGSDYYMETNFSADGIKDLIRKVIYLFGYKSNSFSIIESKV